MQAWGIGREMLKEEFLRMVVPYSPSQIGYEV